MDLERFLERCNRSQWKVGDLDWSLPRRALDPAEERTIVQFFHNLASVERMASFLFRRQAAETRDAKLKSIFESFAIDEERHAQVAERLADTYDLRRLQDYRADNRTARFQRVFVALTKSASPEAANFMVTMGELLLDNALLEAVADFLDDELVSGVLRRIAVDEARHISIDYLMIEHYCELRAQRKFPVRWWGYLVDIRRVAAAIAASRPLFAGVFFDVLELVDPHGDRQRRAFWRIEITARRSEVSKHLAIRVYLLMLRLLRARRTASLAGWVVRSVIGVDPDHLADASAGTDI